MLSTILWILGGIVLCVGVYYLGVLIFAILAVKKMVGVVRSEAQELPRDYTKFRKEVKNEVGPSVATETLVKSVFVRWYDRFIR